MDRCGNYHIFCSHACEMFSNNRLGSQNEPKLLTWRDKERFRALKWFCLCSHCWDAWMYWRIMADSMSTQMSGRPGRHQCKQSWPHNRCASFLPSHRSGCASARNSLICATSKTTNVLWACNADRIKAFTSRSSVFSPPLAGSNHASTWRSGLPLTWWIAKHVLYIQCLDFLVCQ